MLSPANAQGGIHRRRPPPGRSASLDGPRADGGPGVPAANPSVVTIRTTEREIAGTEPGQFTGVAALGSGVLISAEGKIMTAAHVVQLADKITLEFLNGETVGAQVASRSA